MRSNRRLWYNHSINSIYYTLICTANCMSDFEQFDDSEDENLPPSKSSVKREAERLKKIGEKLLSMPDSQLKNTPMTETLAHAIAEGRRLKSREGLRRHKQYIGKLLRDTDISAIEARLSELENAHTLNTRAFHELECLRDDLIKGDNKIVGEVIASFPGIDTQKLRQLVRSAKKELQSNPDSTASSRKLFRFLRDESTGS